MKDFNIAKYLKENHLGSHAIFGRYVDLHGLKEEEDYGNNKPVDEVPYTGAGEKLDGFGDEFDQVDPVSEEEISEANVPDNIKRFAKKKGISSLLKKIATWAEKAGTRIIGGMAIGKNYDILTLDLPSGIPNGTGAIYIYIQDGSIELFDTPVENYAEFLKVLKFNKAINEAEDSEENAWMEDVDGTEAYKEGNWKCKWQHPGILVWSYKNIPSDKLSITATPNFDGDGITPIIMSIDGDTGNITDLNQGVFANFNEYAVAMKPILDVISNLESDAEVSEEVTVSSSGVEMEEAVDGDEDIDFDRMYDLGGAMIERGIVALIDDGFEAQDILDMCRMFVQEHYGARSMGKKF